MDRLIEERFFAKVVEDGECWRWIGAIQPNGYGRLGTTRGGVTKNYYAHRWAYEFMVAEIPVGLTLDHLCRNRWCVNPYHLEPVTQAENNRRMPHRRQPNTHCKNGHDFSETRRTVPSGGSRCYICAADYKKNRKAS